MTLLPGYRRERGLARGYITPEGERISYRAYRKRLEDASLVTHLSPEKLQVYRRKQRSYMDVIDQMQRVQSAAIARQIERAEEIGDEDAVEDYRKELRTLRRTIIKSGKRKSSLQTLKEHAHLHTPEDRELTKQALIALGRRENIPDWVPPDFSDDWRAGKLNPANVGDYVVARDSLRAASQRRRVGGFFKVK